MVRSTTEEQDDDDDGQMITENRFRWDTNTGVPEILTIDEGSTSAASISTNLFYGYGRIAAFGKNKLTMFSKDTYGSTISFGDDDAFVRASSYDPWGNPSKGNDDDDDETKSSGLSFGYRSELHLADEDIYLRARNYDPTTGRFTTIDPLDGVVGELTVANPYHYVDNDPLNKVDPLGLRPANDQAYKPPSPQPCSNLFYEMTVLQIEDAMRAVVRYPCGFDEHDFGGGPYKPVTRYGTKAAPKLAAKPDGECSGDIAKYIVFAGLTMPYPGVGVDLAYQANKNFADVCDSHDYAYDLLRYADFASVWHSNILRQRKISDGVFNEMAGRVCGKTGNFGLR